VATGEKGDDQGLLAAMFLRDVPLSADPKTVYAKSTSLARGVTQAKDVVLDGRELAFLFSMYFFHRPCQNTRKPVFILVGRGLYENYLQDEAL
jgi:hypothetical protein